MTPERWHEVRRIFDDAVGLEGDERAAFLARASTDCPSLVDDVAFLLRSHEAAEDFIEEPFVRIVPNRDEEDGLRHIPLGGPRGGDTSAVGSADRQIGPWAVERVLGRGGMGTVYLASRADAEYHRRVAVKVLRRELDSRDLVRRFRNERQILATLDHPSIARLHDGGTTEDGRPYLVMEYVEGEPLDRYCQIRELPVARRLELFRQVCGAVQFAHQSLVVHRDLKPGNILVTAAGEVKLLDFGIAKLLEPEDFPQTVVRTEPGLAPMTLEYASPEQVRGEPITAASDVYSLGIVLYELLTGRRPYRSDPRSRDELRRAVCEEEPSRPSTAARELRRTLAGDLDNILRKALEKDPQRRYGTAEELSRDIERHLTHRPVLARPGRLDYRAGKFLRRYRWGVAATAAALVALLGFLAALLVQRDRILSEKNRAEEVKRVLVDLFEVSDPDLSRGEEITAREVLERGAVEIPKRLEGQPETQAELLEILGRIHRKLGHYEDAATFHERALDLRRQVHGDEHPAVASSLLVLGECLDVTGDYTGAETRYREALAILTNFHDGDDPDLERGLSGLARVLQGQGRFEESERLYGEALAMARRLFGEAHDRTAWNLKYFGRLLWQRGDNGAAEVSYGEALGIYRELYGEDHPEVAGLYNDIALALQSRGEFERAETEFHRALELQEQLYEDVHPALATTRYNLASLLYDLGRLDDAEELCRQSLDALRLAHPDKGHEQVAEALNLLGLIRKRAEDLDAAESLIREALDVWRKVLGEEHNQVAVGLTNLAGILRARGELDEAETLYRDALGVARAALGDEHRDTLAILNHLGRVLRDRGELEAAEEIFRDALAVRRRTLGDDHRDVGLTLYNLSVVMERAGNLEEAERMTREALRIFEKKLGPEHPYTVRARRRLVELYEALGRPDEAARYRTM